MRFSSPTRRPNPMGSAVSPAVRMLGRPQVDGRLLSTVGEAVGEATRPLQIPHRPAVSRQTRPGSTYASDHRGFRRTKIGDQLTSTRRIRGACLTAALTVLAVLGGIVVTNATDCARRCQGLADGHPPQAVAQPWPSEPARLIVVPAAGATAAPSTGTESG
jgi:hypothetical protein